MCGVSASLLQCFLGFCGFAQGRGRALTSVGSAWDSPLATSPVLEHHLSTAGCFHGDHSSLHGYSGTLAGAWGTCPPRDKVTRGQRAGDSRSQAAAGGQFVTAASLRAQSSPPALSLWEQSPNPSPLITRLQRSPAVSPRAVLGAGSHLRAGVLVPRRAGKLRSKAPHKGHRQVLCFGQAHHAPAPDP